MSLYPSLEDMKVDQMYRSQVVIENQIAQQQLRDSQYGHQPYDAQNAQQPPSYAGAAPDALPYPTSPEMPQSASKLYPNLYDYMGLDLSPELLRMNMPEAVQEPPPYTTMPTDAVAVRQPNQVAISQNSAGMIAPLSGVSAGLHRAQVTHGVREVVLCKDGGGKVGLRVKDVNTGIFVALVQKNSPAALARLRFGDQILQINGENVAGYTTNKIHDIFKKAGNNNIVVAVRDRPFERTITLHRDSVGNMGFGFKNGKIITVVKDSSAARNGVLTNHQLLEIDGQNVVGLKDKQFSSIIDGAGQIITITIMPSFLYDHIMKHMKFSIVKDLMDHSIPDI